MAGPSSGARNQILVCDPANLSNAIKPNADGSINVDIVGGGGTSANVGPTGAAVPTSANLDGVSVGGTLRAVGGLATGSIFSEAVAIVDASGNQITSFGSSTVAISAGQAVIGNVGAKTVSVTVNPTVTTANAYGTNFVVGGLLTFANIFSSTGSGLIQTVTVTMAHVETNGFTFIPFSANPTSSTFTDALVAAINSADIAKVRTPIALSANSQLGTMTIYSATGLGQATSPGATSLYGVLLANAALTNNFTSASEVNVTVTVLQDA